MYDLEKDVFGLHVGCIKICSNIADIGLCLSTFPMQSPKPTALWYAYTGCPIKMPPLNTIRFIRQIKVSIKHYHIIRLY